MAQFVVRNLEDDVHNKLRDLAMRYGKSMEETVREILRAAVMSETKLRPKLGSRFAERYASQGLDEEIAELPGQTIEPPSFNE